jgi:hypothetical protein
MLDNFVRVGQEILSCDWAARYGPGIARVAPSPPGIGYAQPGFLGRDYRGLVFVGQNPGAGALRADAHQLWKRVFRDWHEQGTVAAYSEAFRFWRDDLNAWPVWTQWIKPILERLSLTEDHIGYLNLCKNATTNNTPPTAHMYRSDWAWTRQQLELLQPRVVVAGGVAVDKRLNTHWPTPPFIVLPQNRVRSQSRAERARDVDELASKIWKALQ